MLGPTAMAIATRDPTGRRPTARNRALRGRRLALGSEVARARGAILACSLRFKTISSGANR